MSGTLLPQTGPTLAGFVQFVQQIMGIPAADLPPTAPVITFAYQIATDTVSTDLLVLGPQLYQVAVYNLAADTLINLATDQPGSTFFANLQKSFGINSFAPGVVQSASDNGTGMSALVPDFFKTLTLSELQNLKTPYGRVYLAIAQKLANAWGLN